MSDDPLDALELDAIHRLVVLEELREIRLRARVAGRTDRLVYWRESDDEVDDEDTRLPLLINAEMPEAKAALVFAY